MLSIYDLDILVQISYPTCAYRQILEEAKKRKYIKGELKWIVHLMQR